MTVVEEIIFSARRRRLELPAYLKGFVGAIIVFAAYVYAATRWPVPWYAPLIAVLAIVASVLVVQRDRDAGRVAFMR
ncbi:hypothetical protein V4C53_43840 [Paraburkholderia azotifigens]|uniref:hypothetical protein n=1 Tax=Paraburkholderia azotifigens TaxID=2057004 RepID=UPI00317365DB